MRREHIIQTQQDALSGLLLSDPTTTGRGILHFTTENVYVPLIYVYLEQEFTGKIVLKLVYIPGCPWILSLNYSAYCSYNYIVCLKLLSNYSARQLDR